MKRDLPQSPAEWLHEIVEAMADAREAKPFGAMMGHRITEQDLFHVASHLALDFVDEAQAERILNYCERQLADE
jgi:hypothetical protein